MRDEEPSLPPVPLHQRLDVFWLSHGAIHSLDVHKMSIVYFLGLNKFSGCAQKAWPKFSHISHIHIYIRFPLSFLYPQTFPCAPDLWSLFNLCSLSWLLLHICINSQIYKYGLLIQLSAAKPHCFSHFPLHIICVLLYLHQILPSLTLIFSWFLQLL